MLSGCFIRRWIVRGKRLLRVLFDELKIFILRLFVFEFITQIERK